MLFSASDYGPEVASLLALDGNGERLMPLASGTCSSQEALARLKALTAGALFPKARASKAALAGLYLYFSCLEECHTLAQDIESAEGSFWHGIMHRQEPDAGNSAYWFRRVGQHPTFPALREAAVARGYPARAEWDPFAFIKYCEQARRKAAPDAARRALEIQRAEWQLLFDYCARPA
ncbi:MAG TPA: hypothetical protein VF767_10950 [Bryobacteraceae bacterium]